MAFNFPKTIAAVEEVPEQFRGMYSAVDGGQGLAIHSDFLEHTAGLSSALDKERKNVKNLNTMINSWKALGDSPETIQTKLRELEEQITSGKNGSANWDKMKKDLEDGHRKLLTQKDEEVGAMRKTLQEHLVDNQAISAVAELKGVPELLLPHIRTSCKVIQENGNYVVRVVDKDGDPRGDGKGGFMTIKDLVAEMRTSSVFGRAFEASNTTGGGKPPDSKGAGSAQKEQSEMSPTQKIAAGLRKMSK